MRFWQRQQTEGTHNQGFLGDESVNHPENNNSEYLDLQALTTKPSWTAWQRVAQKPVRQRQWHTGVMMQLLQPPITPALKAQSHKDLGAEEREKARAKLEGRCTGLQVTMAPVNYCTVKNNRTWESDWRRFLNKQMCFLFGRHFQLSLIASTTKTPRC